MGFVIKAEMRDDVGSLSSDAGLTFAGQKTMYGGKRIVEGDTIYIFASETQGGCGLVARGRVVSASSVPRLAGVERQTQRVSITVRVTGRAKRRLGRAELKAFTDWKDGRPEVELNFKLYRQATNKVVGITAETARFLEGFF